MRQRILAATGLTVAAAVATLTAVPASASPPDRFEIPFTFVFPDLEYELAAFVNIDRESYCTDEVVNFENAVIAWLEGGMVGDFPDEPMFPEGFVGLSAMTKETGQGAVVASLSGSGLMIELWHLDAEENRPLVGPCTDTDDEATLFADGTASVRGHDNDLFGSGTRGNAFGDFFQADVIDADGNEYSYSRRFHVNDRCYQPDDGPPACLIETSTLRAK
jgi:hypothetical protein